MSRGRQIKLSKEALVRLEREAKETARKSGGRYSEEEVLMRLILAASTKMKP